MKLNDLLKSKGIVPKKYEKIGKTTIISDYNHKYACKKTHIDKKIIAYLKSRSFDYIPKIHENDEYLLTDYIKEYEIPREQKMIDLIKLTALLHTKTTHYKEVDKDDCEKIYEDINNNLNYLYGYYTDLITIIESKVFLSPSQQLLSRNISKIYDTIENVKKRLDNWHAKAKEKTKERKVVIHGKLELNHFMRNEKSYFISLDKSRIDSPIIDLYRLYQKHTLEFDFESLLKIYESAYPLTKDEKELLYTLISMPDIVNIDDSEYENCKNISEMIDKIYKTEKLVSPKTSEQ